MNFDMDVREYLTALVADNSLSKSAELIGYSNNSFRSISKLLNVYDVLRDAECNEIVQYTPPVVTPKPETLRSFPNVERCVVIGDTHHPYQDKKAISLVMSMIEDIQPEVIVLNGDICDFFALSNFSKDPLMATKLKDEIDSVKDFLDDLCAIAPHAKIEWVEGNHEARLVRYLQDKAPELMYISSMSMEGLFGLHEKNIKYIRSVGRTAYTEYGVVKIGHFNKVSRYSGYTAKNLMDQYQCSLVQAHVHRLGTHYRDVPGKPTMVAVEGGCLCDLDAEYIRDPDWQLGLTIITKIVDRDTFHVQQVPIVNYRALFNDVVYTA